MTERERLADAWRLCLREVDECLFWLRQYQQRQRALYALRLVRYIDYVKQVSLLDAEMREKGMEFYYD